MSDELLQPFYEYLQAERRALLAKLDSIERLMGISPSTAELRRKAKHVELTPDDSLAGVAEYNE